MKKILLACFLIFSSTTSEANNLKISNLMNACNSIRDKISKKKEFDSVMCISYLSGLHDTGVANCTLLKIFYHERMLDNKWLNILSKNIANEETEISRVIDSFLEFSNSNYSYLEDNPVLHKNKYLHSKFPCKIDDK